MLRAVIFDFDGVITDSEILHFRTFNKVLKQFKFQITLQDYYKNYLGLSDLDLFSLFSEKGYINIGTKSIKNLTGEKNELFEQLAKTEGKIIEGVRDFLEILSQNDIPIAICSGALLPEIELILDDAKLRHYFKVIVSAEHVKKGKPSPEGFLLAIKRLNSSIGDNILTKECIVIEDSRWGLEAAIAAKMHTIAVTNSYEAKELSMAEKIVSNLKDLTIDDLKQLCND